MIGDRLGVDGEAANDDHDCSGSGGPLRCGFCDRERENWGEEQQGRGVGVWAPLYGGRGAERGGRRFRPRRERVRDEREVGDDGTDEWTQSVSGREEGGGSGNSCHHRLGRPWKGRQGKGAKASGPAVARASWASGERKRPIGPKVRKGERKERNSFSFSK